MTSANSLNGPSVTLAASPFDLMTRPVSRTSPAPSTTKGLFRQTRYFSTFYCISSGLSFFQASPSLRSKSMYCGIRILLFRLVKCTSKPITNMPGRNRQVWGSLQKNLMNSPALNMCSQYLHFCRIALFRSHHAIPPSSLRLIQCFVCCRKRLADFELGAAW